MGQRQVFMLMEKNIENIPLDKLTGYARNSRTHSDEQVAQIAASIKEFGFTNPILIDDDNMIIAGHGRFSAAHRMGMKEVPCIRLSHLDEAQKKAYVIADNQLATKAGWNYEMLAVEIDELNDAKYDISKIGFTIEELENLIGSPTIPPIVDENREDSDKKPVICPKCSHEFIP
jgi:ParB-like chromosome segregation protein Spo0J